jgi:hypothetical protein
MTTKTTSIAWSTNADAAIEEAARQNKPVLLDFTAAPM